MTKYQAFMDGAGVEFVINTTTRESWSFGKGVTARIEAEDTASRWTRNPGLAPDNFVNDWEGVLS